MITIDQLHEFNSKLKDVKNIDQLIGKDGLITDLFKDTLQTMMEAELTSHLGYQKGKGSRSQKSTSNKRNGHSTKTIHTSSGDIVLAKPRDREGSFVPQILEEMEGTNTNELESKVISLYGRGMTVADINEHLAEMYGVSVTDPIISQITDKIIPEIKQWKNRTLMPIYPIVYIDALHYYVRENGKVHNKAVYVVMAISLEGKKEILDICIGETAESASFWLKVMQNIQARGVEDILILCSDNLSGLSNSVKAVFPKVTIQKCVIHQIRNSLKYIAHKDKKEFMTDLKKIYKADTRDEAEINLLSLEEKWMEKYPIPVKSWLKNWHELSTFFDLPPKVRKLTYTTNLIEGTNRQFRKVTKNKTVFPNDTALEKILFLAMKNITKKWTMPVRDWAEILSQLAIQFEDRITPHL